MTLEAAIVLPCLLMLVMLMVGIIQTASVEIALQSALDETGKSTASYWLPVRTVYGEAKEELAGSKAGLWVQETVNRLQSVHDKWTGAEDWVLQSEAFMPQPVIDLVKWEAAHREDLESSAADGTEKTIHRITDPLLCQTFQPLLEHYTNGRYIRKEHLKVVSVSLPSLEEGGNPYFELTARYEWRLPVPFWRPKVVMEKRTYQRAWVGADG